MTSQAPSSAVCSVCGHAQTDDGAVCSSCGAYIRNRVVNLDLFRTAWGVIEHPVSTFRDIARAEHKNYALFLAALGGVLPVMAFLSAARAGTYFPGLIEVIPLGIVTGLAVGLLSGLVVGLCGAVAPALAGGKRSFRITLGVWGYACVPSILTGLVSMPVQWLTFGEHQFAANPHPRTINELSYWLLTGIQASAIVWSVLLFFIGLRQGLQLRTIPAILLGIGLLAAVTGGWWGVFSKIEQAARHAPVA